MKDIFNTTEYKILNEKYIFDTIDYLFKHNQFFDIICLYDAISFTPELPQSLTQTFKEQGYIHLSVSKYTFESAILTEEKLSIEAGFGEENIGSVINIPLLAIKQIMVGRAIILVNIAEPIQFDVPTFIKNDTISTKPKKVDTKKSMEALLKNPENQKLIKKKKK